MPYLFCEKDSRKHDTRSIEQQEVLRQLDETVLIVKGTLVSGPWQCDSCNAQLKPGDTAMLVSAFPSHCRDDLYDYDFGYERQYFDMMRAGVVVYGAAAVRTPLDERKADG